MALFRLYYATVILTTLGKDNNNKIDIREDQAKREKRPYTGHTNSAIILERKELKLQNAPKEKICTLWLC